MENGSRRMAHGDPRPTHTETHDPHAHHHFDESSDRIFSGFFQEEVVLLLTYVTDFCRVGGIVYFHGELPPAIFNFQARAS